MRLKSILLKNFRSFKEDTLISINDLTVFVGKNDIGKSTILEALEIFFNNKIAKIDSNDATIDGINTDVRIGCVFDNLPTSLSIDTRSQTSLAEEKLLNGSGDLEIVKIFNCSIKTPSYKTYANAVHPTIDGYNNLHLLKNDELKAKYDELHLTTQIDRRSNVQLRRAIWESNTNLIERLSLVSLEEEDGKKIWNKLKDELPIFALFQSDRSSKDEDSEVQDPMSLAVDEAIQSVETELNEIKRIVQERVTRVAERTVQKLNEMNPDLARELRPNFKTEPKWSSIFKLSLTDDNQIPINKRGSGTRRLILINFFRAEAERKQIEQSRNSVIYAIEEPETSQHPQNQKMLIEALLELSQQANCQVLLTTHVPGLAGLLPVEHIRYLKIQDGNKLLFNTCNEELLKEIASQLGVLPDRRIQLIVCVEGPNDVKFLENISEILHSTNDQIPLLKTDPRIAILPLGGTTLKQWVVNHYSRNIGLPEIHIYDRDEQTPPRYQTTVDQVNARVDNSWATLTGKREFENYIHPTVIQAFFGIGITFSPTDDVASILCTAVNADAENPFNLLGDNRAKRLLCDDCSKLMTYEQLNEIDTDSDVNTLFEKICERL